MHYDYGRSLLWHFFFCCSYTTTSLGKGLYYYLVLNAQQCLCWWRDQMMVRKDTFWIIFLQAFSLHYVKHTVGNLSFLYKIELGKIKLTMFEFLNFWAQIQWSWEILNASFIGIIWIFAPKILILCNCNNN